jgi:hypothetical protein
VHQASAQLAPWPAGADDFTPVLIYVTIKACPPSLAANLSFIERYRMQSKLSSESQYYFIQLVGASSGPPASPAAPPPPRPAPMRQRQQRSSP